MVKLPANLQLESATNMSEVLTFRALLVDGKWCGKRSNKIYPIKYSDVNIHTLMNKCVMFYSTASNDYYPIGTPRFNTAEVKKDCASGYWHVFRDKLVIKGTLIAGQIHLDFKHLNKVTTEDYARFINKKTEGKSNSTGRPNAIPES